MLYNLGQAFANSTAARKLKLIKVCLWSEMTLINSLSVFETQIFTLHQHVHNCSGCYWPMNQSKVSACHDYRLEYPMSAPAEDASSASSGIIGRSDFKSRAYGKPVCRMQGAVQAWATRSGPGGGVYPAARETNVPVTWQACVGLGGFLISCALP